MQATAATDFAIWLAKNQPELFDALLQRATAAKSLAGFADVFSSIGSGLANAAKAVGSYIASPQGLETMTQLSSAYLQVKAARDATKINLERAKAGMAPAPIQTVFNPNTQQYEAVLNQNGQQIPVTPQVAQQIMPRIPWLGFGAMAVAAFVIVLLMNRRR